jgi:hypothetical protein
VGFQSCLTRSGISHNLPTYIATSVCKATSYATQLQPTQNHIPDPDLRQGDVDVHYLLYRGRPRPWVSSWWSFSHGGEGHHLSHIYQRIERMRGNILRCAIPTQNHIPDPDLRQGDVDVHYLLSRGRPRPWVSSLHLRGQLLLSTECQLPDCGTKSAMTF